MMQPKLIFVKPLPDAKLQLCYETGENRIFDVTPYIIGSWYGKLENKNYFNTVHILTDGLGIEWRDGQDIAPHELYELSTPC